MPATSPEAIARKRQRDRERKKTPEAIARNRERVREYQRALGKDKRQANNLWNFHGITPAQKQEMLGAQDGRCYLCGDALAYDDAVIDHDHSCCPPQQTCAYCRRGLACNPCNTIIGMAGDDPERLIRIARRLAVILPAVRARIEGKPQQMALDFPEAS